MNPLAPLSAPTTFAVVLGAGLLMAASPARSTGAVPLLPAHMATLSASDSARAPLARVDGRALGRSGALRVAVVRTDEAIELPFVIREDAREGASYRWVPLFDTPSPPLAGEALLSSGLYAPSIPGIWRLRVQAGEETHEIRDFTLITKLPFSEKNGTHLNGYNIGRYPLEAAGEVPPGFIEITPENQDLQVSEHFRLRQFLTKDQLNIWPKYLALDLRLIDKLELVLLELNAMGMRADRMTVMSGFRTPQYNGPGGNGRAKHSRHMFGDAADVWVDNKNDFYISDLNGDGRRDVEDARLMLRAVDRVEQRYPELVGGAGLYNSSGARGPFIHIDVRGHRSRW